MKSLPECEDKITNSKIVLQENKSKITFLNPQKCSILKIKIDDCVISDKETLRCDYGLVPCDDVEIYVELKGNKTSHAIEQIKSTINLVSSNPKTIRKICFIICTKTSIPQTRIQNSKKYLKENFNANLYVKTNQYQYDLSNINLE